MIEKEKITIYSLDQLKEFDKFLIYYAYFLINQNNPFSKKALFLKRYPGGINDVFGDETYVYNYLSLVPLKEGLPYLQESKLYKYYKNVLRPLREIKG